MGVSEFPTLEYWLDRLTRLHPNPMALGLERVAQVLDHLAPDFGDARIVVIGGTNGKGSTQAFLESMLVAAGYRVGAYSSPHLFRFGERIRVTGAEFSPRELCDLFAEVDEARRNVPLTYFEFVTLAALVGFARYQPDVILLEVGLGGRLDAVNVVDGDIAVITSIGLDHQEWLGQGRERIGAEKVAIARASRPLVCGDPDPPRSLLEYADRIQAGLRRTGTDFRWQAESSGWRWTGPDLSYGGLPYPALLGEHQLQNAATALMVIRELAESVPVSREHIDLGLRNCRLPGRFQKIASSPDIYLDVAHNVESMQALAACLHRYPVPGVRVALFSALSDKPLEGMVGALHGVVDDWHIFPLRSERAADLDEMQRVLRAFNITRYQVYPNSKAAGEGAVSGLGSGDRLVVTGSFYTVAEVAEQLGWPVAGGNTN